MQTPDQHKWLAKFLKYKFDIVYKSGAQNKSADALSRTHDDSTATHNSLTISGPQPVILEAPSLLLDQPHIHNIFNV